MITFMLMSAIALFGEMFELIAISVLWFAEVSAIVHSVPVPVAILTD